MIMEMYLSVLFLTTAIFLALILQLAAKPKFTTRLTGIFICCIAVSGLLMYGYAYTEQIGNIPLAVLRALLAVCGMFLSKMDFSVVEKYAFFQTVGGEFLFWLLHFFAMYVTARAAITAVGGEALKKMRLFLARWGDLHLIYGVNDHSMELCSELIKNGKNSVVFVDGKLDSALALNIAKSGCVLRNDAHALQADAAFLRSIGIRRGKRKITLYILEGDSAVSLSYARKFLYALEQRKVDPVQTSLIISGLEDSSAKDLQVLNDRYGYGYVTVFQEANLVSRLLVQNYPPCNYISFDSNGKATDNFEAVLIGFGQIGQAVLRSLVMNGQFHGSQFRADVFALDCERANGFFDDSFREVLDRYDIYFYTDDARSREMYAFLRQRLGSLKYVVISTGSEKLNRQIGQDLNAFFNRNGVSAPVILCSHSGVSLIDGDGNSADLCKLYQPEILTMKQLDQMAMMLNYYYMQGSNKTPLEEWMACDYFSRMSSRASADFIDAFLKATGVSAEVVADGKWNLSEAQMENLARTEHDRWCAFHFCMGFHPMSFEEFQERGRIHRQQKDAGIKRPLRIGKNMEGRSHACLIPWEELPALGEREAVFTDVLVDYQDMDRRNVLAIPEMLRIRREKQG